MPPYIPLFMDEHQSSEFIVIDHTWRSWCDSLRLYPSKKFNVFGRSFTVSHENEEQCVCCILRVAAGESEGDCWGVENEGNCLRCLFSRDCKRASHTLHQLGTLARTIFRARGKQAHRDLERLALVVYDQERWDTHPTHVQKLRMVHKVADIQDLVTKYSDNAGLATDTETPDDISSNSDKGADKVLLVFPPEEMDEETSSPCLGDDKDLLTPADSCSTVRKESNPGTPTEPQFSRGGITAPSADFPASFDLGRPSGSHASPSAKINAFTRTYKNSADEATDLLAAYVQHEGRMPSVYAAVMLSDATADATRFGTIIDTAIRRGVVPDFPAYRDRHHQRVESPSSGAADDDGDTPAGNTAAGSNGDAPRRPAFRRHERQLILRAARWAVDGLGLLTDLAKLALEDLQDVRDNEGRGASRDDEGMGDGQSEGQDADRSLDGDEM